MVNRKIWKETNIYLKVLPTAFLFWRGCTKHSFQESWSLSQDSNPIHPNTRCQILDRRVRYLDVCCFLCRRHQTVTVSGVSLLAKRGTPGHRSKVSVPKNGN